MTKNNPTSGNSPGWPETLHFQNYLRLKAEVPLAILLVEMGAFLEAYGEDAVCVASLLDIALLQRGLFLNGTPIPMCVIPADSRFATSKDSDVQFIGSTAPFLKTLLQAGHAVAIATCQPTTPVTRKIEWMLWPSEANGGVLGEKTPDLDSINLPEVTA